MVNIGILTLINADNYGAMLQSYALQYFLDKNKKDNEIINYFINSSSNNTYQKTYNSKSKLIRRIKKVFKINEVINARIKFMKFKNFRKYRLRISANEYKGDLDTSRLKYKYEYYIVGSDQIWNSYITNNSKAFYLDFCNSSNKIAYAASFGKEDLNNTEIENVEEYLKSFKGIGVREKTSAYMLNNKFQLDAKQVMDPVFLLNGEEWIRNFKLVQGGERYIFVYVMEPSKELQDIVHKLYDKTGYKVKYLSCTKYKIDINGDILNGIGPEDFLRILYNASYVITNSFHGIALSIILNKQFYAIKHSKLNLRINDLLDLCDCSNKILEFNEGNIENYEDYIIDGGKAYKNIILNIEESKKFLLDSLNE